MTRTPLSVLCAAVALGTALSAQSTPTDILSEYRQKSASVLKRTNETLEAQGTKIAATLVSQGDTEGAREVSSQIKKKIAGEPVEKPHSSVESLFEDYDAARTAALKPVREASVAKIDAALKAATAKKMTIVLELGKAREEIEGGKLAKAPTELPEFWTWHLREDVGPSGTIEFKRDGTIEQRISGRNAVFGTWKPTTVEGQWSVTLNNETSIMTVTGSKAVMDWSFGKRYLKVKTP
jgi:hypothetical protein